MSPEERRQHLDGVAWYAAKKLDLLVAPDYSFEKMEDGVLGLYNPNTRRVKITFARKLK